jgi:nitroimidazol reductase NimA-like FMN-containing flavoprotein (pyridoxamine 5'-phosphate oxidase superfamily)
MRRKERQITDVSQITDFILSEQILRVGFQDKDDIYIVPVNYGFIIEDEKYVFYFHGAKAGRKYELAKLNPKVGFEIDGKYSLVDGELACDYTAHFQSVIGNGILSLVENQEEKVLALNSIMKQTTQNSEWTYSKEMLNAVAIFRLDVENFSCKGW